MDTEALDDSRPPSRGVEAVARNVIKTVRENLLFVLTLAAVFGGLMLGLRVYLLYFTLQRQVVCP